jgi:hypothetical protein
MYYTNLYMQLKGMVEDFEMLCADYLELVAAQHETITTLMEEREERTIPNRDTDADDQGDDGEDDS